MSHTLEIVSSVGLLAWAAFFTTALGIIAYAEDAYRTWPLKASEPHWKRVTITRIGVLAVGAILSLVAAGTANASRIRLQDQLATTTQVAQGAQSGVNDARSKIAKLRNATSQLKAEAQAAVNEAALGKARVKRLSAQVDQINIETQRRLDTTDAIAKRAAEKAAASERTAQIAETDATQSGSAAKIAADSAAAAKRAAISAALKAHVYRLPDSSIAAITAAASSLPRNVTVFIFCNPGLEEVCYQLRDAFRAGGIMPGIKAPATFWSGFDADPFAPTNNPNLSIAYMLPYKAPALLIERAMDSAGLRTQAVEMSKNTVTPNVEINFFSATTHS